jgi:hypothetical protein
VTGDHHRTLDDPSLHFISKHTTIDEGVDQRPVRTGGAILYARADIVPTDELKCRSRPKAACGKTLYHAYNWWSRRIEPPTF